MTTRSLRTVLTGGSYFEGPRWHDGSWWVSDFYTHQVTRVAPDGGATVVTEVDAQPSGLGWLPDGTLLLVSMKDQRLLRLDDGALRPHAALGPYCRGLLNDMVVDDAGRAYVGDFGFDLMGGGEFAPSSLKRVDPDGRVTVVAEGLHFPNGAVLAPDGCTLDADGHIWVADGFHGRVVRVAPGGATVEEIAAPEGMGVFACALGGDDGRTLLMCCAPDFLESNRAPVREAVLVATEVDVPHAGRP